MIRPGLTAKLSALIALVGILASGVTGYYAYSANRTLLVRAAERNLQTTVWLLGERFATAVGDVGADVQVLADLPSLAYVAQNDDASTSDVMRDRLGKVFDSFIATHPEYQQIRMITRAHHGLELIRYDRDGKQALHVAPAQLQEKGFLPYVFETLALPPGKIYISRITVNHESGAHNAEGRPMLRVAAPVANDQDEVVGVVVIDVDLAALLQRLRENLPGDYHVYLANEWGDFLVHPDSSQTFGFDKGRRIFMQDTFPSTKPLFDNTEDSVHVSGLTDPQQAGDTVLAFIRRPFGLSAGNRFIVLGVSMPITDVLSGASLLGQSIARIVVISSVLGLLLAILFARALIRPLHLLTHAATHFFTAQSSDPLPLERSDEIGVLARCFDRMRKEILSRIDTLHQKQEELVHMSSHDTLTGLANRTLFMATLEDAIQTARLCNGSLAVMFVDLDRFKQINDQFGHPAGDAVLVAVARRLREMLAECAMVARWGGDEFIVLMMNGPSAQTAAETRAKIQSTMEDALLVDGRSVRISASVGISLFPADGTSAEELLAKADAAMYRSKARD